MSGAVERVASVEVSAMPRAMLLPPEVELAARARRQRRALLAVLVLVIVVVAAAYAGATVLAGNAQLALIASQNQTAALLAEQAQYSEIQTVQGKVDGIEAEQQAVTVTEIDWKSYLTNLEKTLPGDAVVQSISVTSSSPLTPLGAPSSPLDKDRIAEIVLTATTKDVPDTVAWLGALAQLPGYADATPTSLNSTDGGYQVSFTLHVNADAVTNRFGTPVPTPAPTDGSGQ